MGSGDWLIIKGVLTTLHSIFRRCVDCPHPHLSLLLKRIHIRTVVWSVCVRSDRPSCAFERGDRVLDRCRLSPTRRYRGMVKNNTVMGEQKYVLGLFAEPLLRLYHVRHQQTQP